MPIVVDKMEGQIIDFQTDEEGDKGGDNLLIMFK
jgi:hypothetical protein